MKKLLLSMLLVSGLSFGQEAAYHLNGISSSYYTDHFYPANTGLYYSNVSTDSVDFSVSYSISYLPYNGQTGWRKEITFPTDFIPEKTTIVPCNLSNNFIVSIQSILDNYCFVMKMDPDGTVIWSRMLAYSSISGEYGSNSTPLSLNSQDEITILLAPVDKLFLSKLNSNGDFIFSKSVQSFDGGGGKNPGFAVTPTPDGGFLTTMKSGNNPTIIKLTSDLQVDWAKKWSIDSYSHPKVVELLPNGNYCIIGDGDNQTYIAQVDQNGNVLSYKYNLNLYYPYTCKVIDSDSIELVDSRGFRAKVNTTTNNILYTSYYSATEISGIPRYSGNGIDLLDQYHSVIYLNLENSDMGCFNTSTFHHTLAELAVNPGSITDEQILVEDNGVIINYSPTITTTTDVFLTPSCGSLGVKETEKTPLTLYPNPASGGQKINLAVEKSVATKLQIVTLSGKLVETFDLNGSVFNAPQEAGMYFVQLIDQSGNLVAVEKLVVE